VSEDSLLMPVVLSYVIALPSILFTGKAYPEALE
jgi:hypothetical protein